MPSLSSSDLIIKITETMIETSTDHFFSTMKETLGDLSLFYDMDRASIMIYDESMSSMRVSVQWCHVGVMSRQTNGHLIRKLEDFPWKSAHKEGKMTIVKDIEPSKNEPSLSFFTDYLTKYAIMIPLLSEGLCFGFLLLENIRTSENYSHRDEKNLTIIGKLYQDAYHRQKQITMKQNTLPYIQTNFMQNMSHEMKTPLGGIHHALYLLSTTELTEEQESYLRLGQESSEGLNTLIDHMLDITPYESEMKLESFAFNIEEEVLRIYRSFKRNIEQKGLEFIFRFDYRINYDLLGDVIKLRQILTQLMDNAIKFTNTGSITCHIHIVQDDPHTISIAIKDTGIGIADEHIHQLYDPFFQVDVSSQRQHHGAGLGLPIVKRWVDLFHGDIQVESKLNQGTTFTINLPFEKGTPMDFGATFKKRVLWISEFHDQNSLVDALTSMGIQVIHKEEFDGQRVDFIMLDHKMKSMEDIDTYKETYGTPSCLMMVFDHPILRQSRKIDIVIDSPFSRTALMHKLNHAQLQQTKTTEDRSYGVLLHGTALVVDDNRLNRIALESILMKEGIDVILAESGEKAIEMVKRESIDLILMDIQMPVMDGIETTRRIRSLGKDFEKIAIVAVTANAYFNDYDLKKSAKINDVIFKPINMDHLKQILRKYMQTQDVLHVPDDLLSWDEHDFQKRFEGSERIASDVLSIFLKEYPKDLHHIEIAIANQNKEEIIQAVHYFKGSCAYVSGKRAVWVLNRMLEEAKQDILTHMQDNLKILIEEINPLVRHIGHIQS